jgi:hypothetical protein
MGNLLNFTTSAKQIVLIFVTFVWFLIFISVVLNAVNLGKVYGTNDSIYIMNVCTAIFAFICLSMYIYEIILWEEGQEIDVSVPIPIIPAMKTLVFLFLIGFSATNLSKYKTIQEKIPTWESQIYLYVNITILIASFIGASTSSYKIKIHIDARKKKSSDSSSIELQEVKK